MLTQLTLGLKVAVLSVEFNGVVGWRSDEKESEEKASQPRLSAAKLHRHVTLNVVWLRHRIGHNTQPQPVKPPRHTAKSMTTTIMPMAIQKCSATPSETTIFFETAGATVG